MKLINLNKIRRVGLQKVKATKSGLLVMLINIHVLINIEIKNSSSKTFLK